MEGSTLCGQWKVPGLVANGRFQAWWPMEGERKTRFHLLSLSPQEILLKPSIFSLDLKVLLNHGPRPLLMHFLPFSQSINYDYTFQCNKSSKPSLLIWFWLKHWFLSNPWNYGIAHGHLLQAPSYTSEWITASRVISKFDFNATSSWWRTWNSKGHVCLEVEPPRA
jgi:hypothetical protein